MKTGPSMKAKDKITHTHKHFPPMDSIHRCLLYNAESSV